MFTAILVTANDGHLGMQNWKKKLKSKRLHTRNIPAQSWININQWFLKYRHFRVYAILVTVSGSHLDRDIVILRQLSAKNFLTQIWSNFIKRLLRCCHFHDLCYFCNGKWRPSWNAKLQKNQNNFIQETFWHKVGSISNNSS